MSAAANPEQEVARRRHALDQELDPALRYRHLLALAAALADAGQLAEARAACDQATALDPAPHAAHAMLASVLLDLGRIDEAAEAADRALDRAPGDVAMRNLAAGVALRAGRGQAALAHAEAAARLAPADQRALAHQAIALAQLGRDEEARWLLDFDHLLKIAMPNPPPGFARIADFNAALVAGLVARTDLGARHVARTLVGGLRLEDSFTLDPPLADGLRAMFVRAIDGYRATLAVEASHPVRLAAPTSWVVSSWANIMDGSAYETPHMHEGTWMSGVYYPEIAPGAPGADGGAIEFGGHDFGAALAETGPTRRIMPRPGMLVLFPSYFYHRTIPLGVPGRRISIAFDARAAQPRR